MTQTGDPRQDDDPIVELDLAEVGAFLERVGGPDDAHPEGGAPKESDPEESDPEESDPEESDPEESDPEDSDAEQDEGVAGAEPAESLLVSGESSIDGERPKFKLNIPGYEIVGVVGRGATGVVYRARQVAVDRKVALKVLHPELITNRRAVRRLQREARLAARLAHPSIISAIDMGKVDGQWWYAMELVEGVPLSRRIAERGTLTEREVLRLFSPLCDALQHAHEGGVVHRDIKPANILIDRRGRARLVDLGLAMGQNDPSITRTGSTLGTPHYVSPEQARDPSQADVRSDIWSVGATMYHAACGRPPFHAEAEEDGGVAEILSRVLYEPVVDPREYVPMLSKGFALMLRKCLTRAPEQRYQEPWELVADIELLRERRRLDLRGSQLDQFASRRPAWAGKALAAGVVALTIGGTWAITARPWDVKPTPVVQPLAATLGDWPELLAIDRDFEAGRIRHAEALAEVESAVLQSLPESARFLGSELVVRIKDDLVETVDGCLGAGQDDVDRQLLAHEFEAAAKSADAGLDERLRVSTGFERAADLPQGGPRLRTSQWKRVQGQRVAHARATARQAAADALHAAYPHAVRMRVDALLAENRWRDAWQLLTPASTLDWLDLEGVQLDLRGLDLTDRREIVRGVENNVKSDLSHVQSLTRSAVQDARGFLDAELDRLISEINSDRVTGQLTAAERLSRSLDAKHASLGLDIEQLTPAQLPYRSEVEEALGDLKSHEGRRRSQLAKNGLGELESLARPMLSERRYDDARELYLGARSEGWRSSTFDVLDARLRELDLLDEVLARAVAGVVARNGDPIELHFDRISERGRIVALGDDTARLGFRLQQSRSALQVMFRSAELPVRGNVRILEVDDVLDFAGLDDETVLGPTEQLSAAAFLAAEGRPEAARARIRLEDHPASDPLPADLEARVRPLLEANRERADRTDRADRATPNPVVVPRTFDEAYGVPNQNELLRKVHLVWRFSDDSDAGGDLTHPLPTDESRKGAWTARGWNLRPSGYTLDADLAEHADFLAPDIGPTLALVKPLREDRRVWVRVVVTPGDARPDGHLIALSVRGYHALIVDHRFKPQVWFGTGDFRALYDHVVHGNGAAPKNFHSQDFTRMSDGEQVSIEIELRGNTLESLLIGGVEIDVPDFYDEPDRPDPFIRLRSRKPITLHAAEIRGERR